MPNLTRKSLGMHLPLEFQTKSNILVAGVGGGYDVVCALPVALSLRGSGHRVHLASYSFSQLDQTDAEQVAEGLYQVTPSTGAPPTSKENRIEKNPRIAVAEEQINVDGFLVRATSYSGSELTKHAKAKAIPNGDLSRASLVPGSVVAWFPPSSGDGTQDSPPLVGDVLAVHAPVVAPVDHEVGSIVHRQIPTLHVIRRLYLIKTGPVRVAEANVQPRTFSLSFERLPAT